jgi:hypothetical protein
VDPGASLDRCRKSRPTGTRSPDLPARSESLYRLRYPGSIYIIDIYIIYIEYIYIIYRKSVRGRKYSWELSDIMVKMLKEFLIDV